MKMLSHEYSFGLHGTPFYDLLDLVLYMFGSTFVVIVLHFDTALPAIDL